MERAKKRPLLSQEQGQWSTSTARFELLSRTTPKIDGDFKTWVRHLEHYFTLLNVGDGRKTTVLLYYLRDEASNIAFHLNITDATNYDDAKEALMQYF